MEYYLLWISKNDIEGIIKYEALFNLSTRDDAKVNLYKYTLNADIRKKRTSEGGVYGNTKFSKYRTF